MRFIILFVIITSIVTYSIQIRRWKLARLRTRFATFDSSGGNVSSSITACGVTRREAPHCSVLAQAARAGITSSENPFLIGVPVQQQWSPKWSRRRSRQVQQCRWRPAGSCRVPQCGTDRCSSAGRGTSVRRRRPASCRTSLYECVQDVVWWHADKTTTGAPWLFFGRRASSYFLPTALLSAHRIAEPMKRNSQKVLKRPQRHPRCQNYQTSIR